MLDRKRDTALTGDGVNGTYYCDEYKTTANSEADSLIDNLTPEVAILRRETAGQKVYICGAKQTTAVTLLYRVSEAELTAILQQIPAIRYSARITKMIAMSGDYFKIELGSGYFSKVILGKMVDLESGRTEYIAVRKIQSTNSLTLLHDSSDKRGEAYHMTKKELAFHFFIHQRCGNTDDRLALTKKVISSRDSFGTPQLYQILPLFDCSSSSNLVRILELHPINSNERMCMSMLFAHELLITINLMHSKRLYHRDIKPENILLDRNKILALADFGSSAYAANDGHPLTYVTAACDTRYCPPFYFIFYFSNDNFDRDKLNAHKDCWAAGLSICALLSERIRRYVNNHIIDFTSAEVLINISEDDLLAIYKKKLDGLFSILREEAVPVPLYIVLCELLNIDYNQFKSAEQILAENCLMPPENYGAAKQQYISSLNNIFHTMQLYENSIEPNTITHYDIQLILISVLRHLTELNKGDVNKETLLRHYTNLLEQSQAFNLNETIKLLYQSAIQHANNFALDKRFSSLIKILSKVDENTQPIDYYHDALNLLKSISYLQMDSRFSVDHDDRPPLASKPFHNADTPAVTTHLYYSLTAY